MNGIDQSYNQLLTAKRQLAEQQRLADERERLKQQNEDRLLSEARTQVYGIAVERVSTSTFSWAMKVMYCSECPCIIIYRNDIERNAVRILVGLSTENESIFCMEGEAQWYRTQELDFLRTKIDYAVAQDLASYNLGMRPTEKAVGAVGKAFLIILGCVVGIFLLIVIAKLAISIIGLMLGICFMVGILGGLGKSS